VKETQRDESGNAPRILIVSFAEKGSEFTLLERRNNETKPKE
jgi:hypothetical protein